MAEAGIDQPDRLYKKQGLIRNEDVEAKKQVLKDNYGDYVEYYQKVTLYNQNRVIVRVIENLLPGAETDTLTVQTVGPYFKPKNTETEVFYQNVVTSKVSGDVYRFMQEYKLPAPRVLKERGIIFKGDKMEIRIFQLFNENDEEIDRSNQAVVVETVRSYTDIQDTICNNLSKTYKKFFDGKVYRPSDAR